MVKASHKARLDGKDEEIDSTSWLEDCQYCIAKGHELRALCFIGSYFCNNIPYIIWNQFFPTDYFSVFVKSQTPSSVVWRVGTRLSLELLFWCLQWVDLVRGLNIVSICVGYTPPRVISILQYKAWSQPIFQVILGSNQNTPVLNEFRVETDEHFKKTFFLQEYVQK